MLESELPTADVFKPTPAPPPSPLQVYSWILTSSRLHLVTSGRITHSKYLKMITPVQNASKMLNHNTYYRCNGVSSNRSQVQTVKIGGIYLNLYIPPN